MQNCELRPLEHPAAWTTGEINSPDDIAVDLTRGQWEVIDAAVHHSMREAPRDEDVTPATFPLDGLGDAVGAWKREIHRGRGIVLLRGLPVERYDTAGQKRIALGLGCHFGRPVSQSAMGDLVGEVMDVGGKDRRERAYRNSRELRLHTDRCDHIGMLCIRPALSGGISGYASALTVHNIILDERPDLLRHLYRGFHHHRFGGQGPGEPPVTAERIPVFSVADGVPNVIWIRGYIDLAVEEGHVDLGEGELEALDYMDSVCNRPEVRLDFRLETGDFALTNNCLLLHTRTAFEDAREGREGRYLLRLWLREDGRPMVPGVRVHKGAGGIAKRAGRGTYYRPMAKSA